ncbi:MAG: 3-oxoacyl-ACP reductase FabG [Rhizobiaceae bacterium]|nr:3-oxoacyl-ACP reductase FabG [Rhizobiaceae bacterium]
MTGGTSGIGLATARYLLARGHRVAIFGQRAASVESAVQILSSDFGSERLFARITDLAAPAEITTFFEDLRSCWRTPEILICNAGVSPKGPNGPTPFQTLTLNEWNDVLAVNLTGAMLCCQAVVPGMVAEKFGRIVFVGSLAGRAVPRIAGSAYVVSKAALSGLARSLVPLLTPQGITVNVVAPGRIATEMSGASSNETNRAAIARIPAGRLGEPEEVAAAIGFLTSEKAAFISGAIIDVNGGEYAPV